MPGHCANGFRLDGFLAGLLWNISAWVGGEEGFALLAEILTRTGGESCASGSASSGSSCGVFRKSHPAVLAHHVETAFSIVCSVNGVESKSAIKNTPIRSVCEPRAERRSSRNPARTFRLFLRLRIPGPNRNRIPMEGAQRHYAHDEKSDAREPEQGPLQPRVSKKTPAGPQTRKRQPVGAYAKNRDQRPGDIRPEDANPVRVKCLAGLKIVGSSW